MTKMIKHTCGKVGQRNSRLLLSLIPQNSSRRVKLQKYRGSGNENLKVIVLDDISSSRQEAKSTWSIKSVVGKTWLRFFCPDAVELGS